MKKFFGIAALVSIAWMGSAQADSLPAPGKATVGGIKVHGLVDTYYGYSFNRPSTSGSDATGVTVGQSGQPQATLRAYDTASRQFAINQATVGLSADANPVGFDVRLGVGNQLEILNANAGTSESTIKHLRKATVSWAPGAFSMVAGRMDADFGFERIDSVDNWNYGRSMLFVYNQPKFFTGLKLGYDFGAVDVSLAYLNGVDKYTDNNQQGSYQAQVNWAASSKTTFNASYLVGPERYNLGRELRHYLNVNGKHWYSDTFALGADLNFTRGRNELIRNSTTLGMRRESTNWYGLALYAHASFMADHWDTVRFEWLHDEMGVIDIQDRGNNYLNTTFTHKYMVSKNLSLLGELRWDHAVRNAYVNSARDPYTRNNQVTLLAAATFNI
jgi:hypothetical protein